MKPPRNFWPLGILAAFGLFVPAMACLIVMAVTHREQLVSADYYEQEIRYQGQIDRLRRTQDLGAQAAVTYDQTSRRIAVVLPAEHARGEIQGRIQLYRPSEAGLDRQVELAVNADGAQSLDAHDLRPGLWKVRVSWKLAGREYFLDQSVVIPARAG